MKFISFLIPIFIIILSINNINSKENEKTCGKIIEISDEKSLNKEDLNKNNEKGENTYIIKTNKTLEEMESLLSEKHLKNLNDKKAEKARKKAIKKAAKKLRKELKKRQSKILIADSSNDTEINEIKNIDILDEKYLNNLIIIDTTKKSKKNLKNTYNDKDNEKSYAYVIFILLFILCFAFYGIKIRFEKEKSNQENYFIKML